MRCIKLGVGGERLAAGVFSVGFSSDNMLVTLCPSDCSWLLTSFFCQVFLGCTVQPLVFWKHLKARLL